MTIATKVGAHGGVKAKSKKGKVTRSKPVPATPAQEHGMCAGVGLAVGQSLDVLLDSLVAVGRAVWEFLGKVYTTVFEWCSAVLSWIGDQIKAAVGKAKEAFAYVRKLVSSKNVDWIAVNTTAIKVLCAAAAVAVGMTGGIIVGSTLAGVAAGAGASAGMTKLVGILTAAVSGSVLAEACYTLSQAGVRTELIAKARAQALAAA